MIGALHGTITAITEQTVLLMVGGVGYEVAVPHPSRLTLHSTTQLYTYLAVRETALDLYGFTEPADREVFSLLLGVPKIGPKSALQVLSQAETDLLFDCIQTDDPSRLHKLSGIGKKTCENIVTNLRDKVENFPEPSATAANSALSSTQADAIDALVSLGYDPKSARSQVLALADKDLSVSDLVAAVLR